MEPSKTLPYDDAIPFDSQLAPWLTNLLPHLKAGRVKGPLWSFDYSQYVTAFKAARERIGLPHLVPYQARHSGASVDRALGHRALTDIKKRGRWRNDSSIARYEKSGRLARSAQMLSPSQLAAFEVAESQLEAVFTGRKDPATIVFP